MLCCAYIKDIRISLIRIAEEWSFFSNYRGLEVKRYRSMEVQMKVQFGVPTTERLDLMVTYLVGQFPSKYRGYE